MYIELVIISHRFLDSDCINYAKLLLVSMAVK